MSKKILQRIRRKNFSTKFFNTNDNEEYYQNVNSIDLPIQYSQKNINQLNKDTSLNLPLQYRPEQQIFYTKVMKNKSLITEDYPQNNITQYSIRKQNISTIYKKNIPTSPRIHINHPVYQKRIRPSLHKKKLPSQKERLFSGSFNNTNSSITNNRNNNISQDSKANIHEIIIDMPQFNTNNTNSNNTFIYNSKFKTMKTNSSSYSTCFYPKNINKNSNYTIRDSTDNLREIYNDINNNNNNSVYNTGIISYSIRKKKYIPRNNNNSVNNVCYSQRNNNDFEIEDHYNNNSRRKKNKSENFLVHNNNNINNDCSNFFVFNENEFFDQAAIMIQSTFRGYNFRYKLCNILTRFDKIRNIYDILKNEFNKLGKEVWQKFLLILKKQTKLLAEKKFYNDYVINNENSGELEICKIKNNITETSKNYCRDNCITFTFFHKAKNSCFYLAEQLIKERDELKKELSEVIINKNELEEKLKKYEKNDKNEKNNRLEKEDKLRNLIIKKILYQNKILYLYFYKYYYKIIRKKRLDEIEIKKNKILRKIINLGNKAKLYKYFYKFLYKGNLYHKSLIKVNKKNEIIQNNNNEMDMFVEQSRNEREKIINSSSYKKNHVKKIWKGNNQGVREEKKTINNIFDDY